MSDELFQEVLPQQPELAKDYEDMGEAGISKPLGALERLASLPRIQCQGVPAAQARISIASPRRMTSPLFRCSEVRTVLRPVRGSL